MRWLLLSVAVVGLSPVMAEVPTLINGRPANPSDFPASVWTRSCSATVVGPRAVFIAAHCVSSGTISFSVGPTAYRGECLVSRAYSGNPTADYAMCLTDKVVAGIPYERINTDPALLRVGGEVLLSGYGCVRPGGSGGNDGVYRIGEARVSRLPSGSNNDIVTGNGAALCFGDSGGPAFLFTESGNSMTRARVVISTNSRGDIATTSYLSSTSTAEGIRFFNAWAERTAQRICGVHADAQGCRGDDGGGNENPNFRIAHPVADLNVTVKEPYRGEIDAVRKLLLDALDALR